MLFIYYIIIFHNSISLFVKYILYNIFYLKYRGNIYSILYYIYYICNNYISCTYINNNVVYIPCVNSFSQWNMGSAMTPIFLTKLTYIS